MGDDTKQRPEGLPVLLDTQDLGALVTHYEQYLGPPQIVLMGRELWPVNIAVYAFPACPERPYVTLATTGMSAIPMQAPIPTSGWDRAELITYLPSDWDFEALGGHAPENLLDIVGRFPHILETWLGEGHTIELEGTAPLFPESLLTTLLVRAPIFEHPDFFHFRLPSGGGCHIYWLVPITTDECYHARQHGSADLNELLDLAGITVIDVDRGSVTSRESRKERRARQRSQRARARRAPRQVLTDIRCVLHQHGEDEHADSADAAS